MTHFIEHILINMKLNMYLIVKLKDYLHNIIKHKMLWKFF